MILADTGVWIDYFNGNDNPLSNELDRALEKGVVVLGDLIFLEILQGFKRDKDYKQAKTALSKLEHYEMLGRDQAIKSADNYRLLRKKGLTIRKTTDVVIATFCIEHKLSLLFSDRDFLPFIEHLGLIPATLQTD